MEALSFVDVGSMKKTDADATMFFNAILKSAKLNSANIPAVINELKLKSSYIQRLFIDGVTQNGSYDPLSMIFSNLSNFIVLIELNLSNSPLSTHSLGSLCKYVNVVQSGYCPLKRLIIIRSR